MIRIELPKLNLDDFALEPLNLDGAREPEELDDEPVSADSENPLLD